jgi:hypothetical protein
MSDEDPCWDPSDCTVCESDRAKADAEETSNPMQDVEDAQKLMVFEELLSYPRFCLWVEANYQIHRFINHDEKRIEVKVIEEDLALAQQNLARSVKDAMGEKESKIQVVGAEALSKLK